MTIPYDELSPKERIELERLIHESTTRPEPRAMPVFDDEAGVPLTPAGAEPDAPGTGRHPDQPTPLLNLRTGTGWWNGHAFEMTPAQLKRVHAIVTECIEAALSAEIARLREETQ